MKRVALPVVIALTAWFDIAHPIAPILATRIQGRWSDLIGFVPLAFYVLGPIRWLLVLWLLIDTVRARPLPMVPPTPALQIGFVVIWQVITGALSLIGALALWVERDVSERIMGFVLHGVLPTLVVIFVWLRRDVSPAVRA